MPYSKDFAQLTFREQLVKRSYRGGSNIAEQQTLWIPQFVGKRLVSFTAQTRTISAALINNIDEILVNAYDHCMRFDAVSKINIEFRDGVISCCNNGPGIPVVRDWQGRPDGETCWLPEAVFARDSVGSNFNDEVEPDRITGGLNGLGAKVVTAGSKLMRIETVDAQHRLKYSQEIRDNMSQISEPVITACTDAPWTRITWRPDYATLCKGDIDMDTVQAIIVLRAQQICTFVNCLPYRYVGNVRHAHANVRITYNSCALGAHDMKSYMQLFGCKTVGVLHWHSTDATIRFPRCIGIGLASELQHTGSILVNGVAIESGSHVNFMKRSVCEVMADMLKQRGMSEQVFDSVFCWFDMSFIPFNQFNFNNQTKDSVKLDVKYLNVLKRTYTLDTHEKTLRHVVEPARDHIKFLLSKREFLEDARTARTRVRGFKHKYEPASYKGRDRSACALAVPEGDSALTLIQNVLKLNKKDIRSEMFGTYVIQGVPPNALKSCKIVVNPKTGKREFLPSAKLLQNAALHGLMQVLNLKYEYDYAETAAGNKQFAQLRYGRLIMATDQDLDGIGHICSLALVFILTFWPNLVRRGFFWRIATPVIHAYYGNDVHEFYSEHEFTVWYNKLENTSGVQSHYVKGLAGHTRDEQRIIAQRWSKSLYKLNWDDICEKVMNDMYNESSETRKVMLQSEVDTVYEPVQYARQCIGASQHFLIESKSFQLSNMRRKLRSAIDGWIPTQRKAVAAARKMKFSAQGMKIYQIAAKVATSMNYVHGNTSLEKTITYMAQEREINLPAFQQVSEGFGSRSKGRSAHGAARYIDARYNTRLMNMLLPPQDDPMLPRVYEEGKRCEPQYYIPIMPLSILEHETTTATGWNIEVWARSWKRVLENVRALIAGRAQRPLKKHVWLRTTGQSIRVHKGVEYCFGSYTRTGRTVHISDLPPRVWTKTYSCRMQGIDPRTGDTETTTPSGTVKLQAKPGIERIVDRTANFIVDMDVELSADADEHIAKYGRAPANAMEHYLEIYKPMHARLNMIDTNNYVREFKDYEEVVANWFVLRRELYVQRIAREKILLELRLQLNRARLRYINERVANKIVIDRDFTDAQRITILQRAEYPSMDAALLDKPSKIATTELRSKILQAQNYDYIDALRVRDMSSTSIAKLQQVIRDLETQLTKNAETTWQTLWLQELQELDAEVQRGHREGWYVGKKIKAVKEH